MNTKEFQLICVLFTDESFDIIWWSGLILLVSITQSRFLFVGSIFVVASLLFFRNIVGSEIRLLHSF